MKRYFSRAKKGWVVSTNSGKRRTEFSDKNILQFIRTNDDPCVTAGEIAEEFNVSNEAVNYRLKQLREEGKVRDKRAGASAKVWYIVG